jgi:hypothetical protein
LKALKRRRRDPTTLKLPVTRDLLEALIGRINNKVGKSARRSRRDNTTYIAAISNAWIVLLRSAEYCSIGGELKDYCLRLSDVALYDGQGRLLELECLDDVQRIALALRGSKTDQDRIGCIRDYLFTREAIDPLAAIVAMLKLRTSKELADVDSPLFVLDSGEAISNIMVNDELKDAAESMGLSRSRYASHSLRRGGATAMAAAGIGHETIRRWGRWLSDTWRRYIFSTKEGLGNVGQAMVSAKYTIAMAVEDFRNSSVA